MPRWDNKNREPLAILRANAGFSAERAAQFLNIVMMTLYRYENGINDIPLTIAEKMAKLYKVPFDDIREAARNTKNLKGNSKNDDE